LLLDLVSRNYFRLFLISLLELNSHPENYFGRCYLPVAAVDHLW
jgi:hypothetical protein